ncbi:MAG: energy transducer TonB [Chitinophagaceae bacterium]|nr:energy transducer TonB [Chitinophagaceae bacterium]
MKYLLLACLCLMTGWLQAQNQISSFKIERTACFGRCPVYTLELRKNGTIIYVGKKNVTMIGTHTGTLPLSLTKKFLANAGKYKIISLSNNYTEKASDLPRLICTFHINKKMKVIKNAQAGPEYLVGLALELDNLLEKVKWKGVSKYPPVPPPPPPPAIEPVEEEPVADIIGDNPGQTEVYTITDQMPEFPGGQDAMMTYLRQNLKYPEMAKEAGIQGRVICGFVVNEDGQISDVTVLRGIGNGCDQEAIRVIKSMPNWKPGRQNGRPVKVKFNLPINFKLQ